MCSSDLKKRVAQGGHDVPIDKIKARYDRCLSLIPKFVDSIDNMILYDNTDKILLTLIKKDKNITVVSNNIEDKDWFLDKILEPLKRDGYDISFVKKTLIKFLFMIYGKYLMIKSW